MGECNSIKHDFYETPNIYPNLNANKSIKPQSRLNKINEIKDYFLAEIRERGLINKNTSNIVLSISSIASFATVIRASARTTGSSFDFTFLITPGFIKRFSETTRNKKIQKQIVMLARSKLNSIETKTSKALMDN